MDKNKTIITPLLIFTGIWVLMLLLAITGITATGVCAHADDVDTGVLYVEGDGTVPDGCTLRIKNSLYQSDVIIPFDGTARVDLAEGSYFISCESADTEKTLVFETNTFDITAGEKIVLHAAGGTAAKLYLRPTLFDGYGGTIEVTLTGMDDNSEYTFTVPRYGYDYATWNDSYYWAEFDLPEGAYEVTALTFENEGRYFRCYVKEKTVEAFGSWSGMLYMTVLDKQISDKEAGIVYTEAELPEETQAPEATAIPEAQESKNSGLNIPLIILAVGLSACMLSGVLMLLAEKRRKERKKTAYGNKK